MVTLHINNLAVTVPNERVFLLKLEGILNEEGEGTWNYQFEKDEDDQEDKDSEGVDDQDDWV